MNRPIKYRAWDKREKGFSIRAWPKMSIEADGKFGFPEDELYEVMQFTGLLDKNGKEIYEGDIVRCTNRYDESFVWAVRFSEGHFHYYDSETWLNAVGGFADNGGSEEVIGNIYENPELLTSNTSPAQQT